MDSLDIVVRKMRLCCEMRAYVCMYVCVCVGDGVERSVGCACVDIQAYQVQANVGRVRTVAGGFAEFSIVCRFLSLTLCVCRSMRRLCVCVLLSVWCW